MVITLRLSDKYRNVVVAGTSPLAELMTCLHVLAEPDHHPESKGWVDRISVQFSDALRADLFRFAPLWARYRMRLFYPTDKSLGRTVENEFERLSELDDEIFLPLAANAIRGRAQEFQSAQEVLSQRRWVTECQQRSFNRGELASSLVANPEKFRVDLIAVLRDCCTAFFTEEWKRIAPRLTATANLVNGRIHAREDLQAIVSSVSKMASPRGSTTSVFFDKLQSASGVVDDRGLLLVPSMHGWPHVIVKMDPGLPIVIQFLEQEWFTEGDAQSQVDIRKRLLALAEPGRWELCRHLIGESITTSELAARTNLTAPAVSRHLHILREAGLISSQRDGRQVFHRLHPSLILHLGQEVLSAIIR